MRVPTQYSASTTAMPMMTGLPVMKAAPAASGVIKAVKTMFMPEIIAP